MPDKQAKAHPDHPRTSGLVDLGREMVRPASLRGAEALAHAATTPGAPMAPGARAMAVEVELAMADLQADANGEIVFFNDSGFRRLAIRTDATVIADGRSGAHRTAAGADVGGFSFVRFDNGLTLYYEGGLDLVVGAG